MLLDNTISNTRMIIKKLRAENDVDYRALPAPPVHI